MEYQKLKDVAQSIKDAKEGVFLIYAFNGTGKTRLSTEYKEMSRDGQGFQTGVYYNAFSEDLFMWDNDIEHSEIDVRLTIHRSSLNQLHSSLSEETVLEKLKPYHPKYLFEFKYYDNVEDGIESVCFHIPGDDKNIKISRGEERIFIWCFFLALFDTEGWADRQNEYIFIDDPVSSLDDHNIFITAFMLFELMKKYYETRKIVVTTHHIGFATILGNWLSDKNNPFADKKGKGNNKYSLKGLSNDGGVYHFTSFTRSTIWLYHLRLLQVLDSAIQHDENGDDSGGLSVYHLAILRQLLENIASFLGVGQFSCVLDQIGYTDVELDKVALIVNTLTHRDVYFPQSDIMSEDNKNLVKDIFNKIQEKYKFQY